MAHNFNKQNCLAPNASEQDENETVIKLLNTMCNHSPFDKAGGGARRPHRRSNQVVSSPPANHWVNQARTCAFACIYTRKTRTLSVSADNFRQKCPFNRGHIGHTHSWLYLFYCRWWYCPGARGTHKSRWLAQLTNVHVCQDGCLSSSVAFSSLPVGCQTAPCWAASSKLWQIQV